MNTSPDQTGQPQPHQYSSKALPDCTSPTRAARAGQKRRGLHRPRLQDSGASRGFLDDSPQAVRAGMERLLSGLQIINESILELIAATRRLATDPTTGLLCRAEGESVIVREVARAHRTRGPLSFLLVDIDKFKAFNDGPGGHAAGDQVLSLVGRELLAIAHARLTDSAIRFGTGDELLLVLPDTDIAGASVVAVRICRAVRAVKCNGRGVTVSVGVATLRRGETAAEALKRADMAMYQAKRQGGNRVGNSGLGQESNEVAMNLKHNHVVNGRRCGAAVEPSTYSPTRKGPEPKG